MIPIDSEPLTWKFPKLMPCWLPSAAGLPWANEGAQPLQGLQVHPGTGAQIRGWIMPKSYGPSVSVHVMTVAITYKALYGNHKVPTEQMAFAS